MQITEAKFIKSSTNLKQCPGDRLPEFAFIGRSNVGKSSLINFLTQNNSLAKASKTPGKTKEINHFLINNERYLVDLPGYGYAKSSRSTRAIWLDFIYDFLTKRTSVKRVFVLIDAKIPPQKIDLEFIEELHLEQIPFDIIFTKIDKATQKEVHQNRKNFEQEIKKLQIPMPQIFVSTSVKQRGKDQILSRIEELL